MNICLSNDAPHETKSLFDSPHQSTPNISALNNANIPKVLVNKLGDYYESQDTNATIPIPYQCHRSTAILDGSVGVSIIIRQCWEGWGRLEFETTTLIVVKKQGER